MVIVYFTANKVWLKTNDMVVEAISVLVCRSTQKYHPLIYLYCHPRLLWKRIFKVNSVEFAFVIWKEDVKLPPLTTILWCLIPCFFRSTVSYLWDKQEQFEDWAGLVHNKLWRCHLCGKKTTLLTILAYERNKMQIILIFNMLKIYAN